MSKENKKTIQKINYFKETHTLNEKHDDVVICSKCGKKYSLSFLYDLKFYPNYDNYSFSDEAFLTCNEILVKRIIE